MAPRALGALLALVAALAFAVSIATSAWWAGHPVVDGRPISAKDVHVGLLGAEGCNTGGDGSCEAVELGATFKLATYGELAVVGLTALLAVALAISAWKIGDRRKGLARTTMTFALLAAAGAGVVLLLGPSIKASQRVDVPIGWGLYVFGGAIASSLLAGAIARKLEPEPLRLKPGAAIAAPIAVAPHADVREMLQQDAMLHPGSRTSEPRLAQHHGQGHEPPHRESVPLFNAAPQLRPLYDPHNAGIVPAPPQPVLPVRAPTPLPYQAVKELTGMPTPPPVNAPTNGLPDPFARTAPAPALRGESEPTEPPPSRAAPPTRTNPPPFASANPAPRANTSTNPPPNSSSSFPPRASTSTNPPFASTSTNPPPSASSSVPPRAPSPTNPPPFASSSTNPSPSSSSSFPPPAPSPMNPPPRPNPPTHPPPLASSSASFPARPNTPANPPRPKPLSMPPMPAKASPTAGSNTTPPPGGRTAIMGAVPPPAIEAVPARGGKKVTVPPPARNTPAPRASQPTLAHAVPPMPGADDHAAPAERGERATTEADDRLEAGMRETEAFDAVGETTDIGLVPTPETPPVDEPVDATDQTKAPESLLERNPKAATPIAPAPVAPTPVAAEPAAPKIPITTAPSTLPPPKKVTETTSGPTPACPQCEAPMAWVDEHLRFYCKSCRMYF